MQASRFDELTKALADSTSRRHALRTIVTASIGSLVGLGGIPSVFGNKIKCGGNTSNSDCAHWCAAVFGPNTAAAGKCSSDAAHGTGVCCQCGTKDPASICCVRNSKGYCSGGAVVGCACDSSQCQSCDTSTGTCVGCASGQTCLNSHCCANDNICGSVCLSAPCDANQCLTCHSSTGICVSTCSSGQNCCNGTCAQCCSDGDCPVGQVCQNGMCHATGTSWQCSCNDTTAQGVCSPTPCSGNESDVCGPACADHGGWEGSTVCGGPPCVI